MPVTINLNEYTLQKSEKSFCGHCGHPLHLLLPHELIWPERTNAPTFGLCERCGQIVQTGVEAPVAPPEPERSGPTCIEPGCGKPAREGFRFCPRHHESFLDGLVQK
jgi:hypothetical protein